MSNSDLYQNQTHVHVKLVVKLPHSAQTHSTNEFLLLPLGSDVHLAEPGCLCTISRHCEPCKQIWNGNSREYAFPPQSKWCMSPKCTQANDMTGTQSSWVDLVSPEPSTQPLHKTATVYTRTHAHMHTHTHTHNILRAKTDNNGRTSYSHIVNFLTSESPESPV